MKLNKNNTLLLLGMLAISFSMMAPSGEAGEAFHVVDDQNNEPREQNPKKDGFLDGVLNFFRPKPKPEKTGTGGGSTGTNAGGGKGNKGAGGGNGVTSVAGETGLGRLGAREDRAVKAIGDQTQNFSAKGEKPPIIDESRLAVRIRDNKIIQINDFRKKLASEGLTFDDLKECEGLPSYKLIEAKIDAFYAMVEDNTNIEEQSNLQAMIYKKITLLRL